MIDDGPWFDGDDSDAFERGLEALADRLETARSRGERVGAYVGLEETSVAPRCALWEVLFGGACPFDLSRDVRRRLALALDKVQRFEDLVGIDVEIDGNTIIAPSVAFAHANVTTGHSIACLTPTTSQRRGPLAVSSGGTESIVWFVTEEADHVGFFRDLIEREQGDHEMFAAIAPSAFPRLRFVERCFKGLHDLTAFRELRPNVIQHLSVLSDDGARIFALRLHKDIESQFGALGVTISPETTETMRDGKCRRARERHFEGELLVFEWHTKLEPHQNRIHVHPGTPSSSNLPIVGIFHKHLRLPGD